MVTAQIAVVLLVERLAHELQAFARPYSGIPK